MAKAKAPVDPAVGKADLIAAAAVRLAGQKGWRGLSLGDIATEAGTTLADLARCYASRLEILDGFERMIDREMLTGFAAGDVGDKPRDRLFDIIMERFDKLAPYREGVRRIARELPFDPASGVVIAASLPRSIFWMLTGARIAVAGPLMPVKLMALTGLYLSVFRVWVGDDDPDLSKTMATLDRQIDRLVPLLGREFARDASTAEPEAAGDGAVGSG